MRKKQLIELLAALNTKRQEARTAARVEIDRQMKALSEGQKLEAGDQDKLNTLQASVDAVEAEIKTAEAELAQINQLEEAARRAALESPAPQISNPHDRAEDRPFRSLGEQLLAVQKTQTSRGNDYDARLRKLDLHDPNVRLAAGMSEGVGTDGGFLLTVDFANTLIKAAFESGDVAGRVTKIPISSNSNSVKIPYVNETSRVDGSRWGGIRGYWLAEAGSITASKPKFDVMTLDLKKFGILAYMTDELLMDATAAEAYLNRAAADEVSFGIDNAIFRGTGAGQPLGIIGHAATVVVTKETSQAAGTILYQNVSKMKSRLLPRSFQRAVWYVNADAVPQLESMFIPFKNVAGTENVGGASVYLPPGGASGQPYGTLFGRPVIPVEQCSTVGTVGDILLVDPEMYVMATKGGVSAAQSIHVNFLTDETAFRFILRTDGQPGMKQAITPAQGSNTLSGFVSLQTRS